LIDQFRVTSCAEPVDAVSRVELGEQSDIWIEKLNEWTQIVADGAVFYRAQRTYVSTVVVAQLWTTYRQSSDLSVNQSVYTL